MRKSGRRGCRIGLGSFVFSRESLTLIPETRERRRYHFHENIFGKHSRAAVRRTGIHKRVTAHTFRHSFASHFLVRGI